MGYAGQGLWAVQAMGGGEADNYTEEKRKLQDQIRELFPCHEIEQ